MKKTKEKKVERKARKTSVIRGGGKTRSGLQACYSMLRMSLMGQWTRVLQKKGLVKMAILPNRWT